MKAKSLGILAFVLLFTVLFSAVASGAQLTAKQILDKAQGETSLSGSGSATIELVTVNKRGQERSNQLKIYRQEGDNGSKQLLEYLTPADVAGTKFLSIDNGDGETMMWLYLPALGRERRISGSTTQSNFMGTDFTFEEIGGAGTFTDDYKAERLADETYQNMKTYVLRLTPLDPKSDYSYVKMWVWQEHLIPVRIEFFNQRGMLDKVLADDDLRQNEKGEWQPNTITMSNESNGTKTIIHILETDDSAVSDDLFTLRFLRR